MSQHIGNTYKESGGIRATIDNLSRFIVPVPVDPVKNYQDKVDAQGDVVTSRSQVTYIEDLTMRQEVDLYVKRKATLTPAFRRLIRWCWVKQQNF